MTERWEQRLRDLHVDTPPDMWQRVQGGPRNEPPIGLPPRRQRVTVAFVALAIFVAAGLFAWQAFRPSATTVGSSSPTPPPGMAVYTDSLGWTAVYPSDWSVTTEQQTADGLGAGVTIANHGPADKIPVDDVVSLTISHPLGATPDPSAGSSSFPLSADDFKVIPGSSNASLLQFKIDGVSYLATLHIGSAPSSADVTAMDGVISSIRPSAVTPSPSPGSVSVTKAGSLDVSGLGHLAAAQEAYGSLWVGVLTDTGTEVDRVDPATGATEHTFPIQGWSPNEWGGNGIVVGGGNVWVPGRENGHATIVRIDPGTDGADVLDLKADTIAYLAFGSDGMLWANIGTNGTSAIARADPTTGEILRTWPYTADWAQEICEAQGTVWVHEMSVSNSNVQGGWLSQVVPGTAPQVETGGTFAGPVCSADAVWTAINGDDKAVNLANGIAQIDPATGLTVGSWSTPPVGYDIALDAAGGVWFLTASSGSDVERLDPSTGTIDAKEAVSGTPIFISSSADHVWVGTYEGQLIRFDVTRQ